MDTYCWIHGTFSIPERWVGKQGVDVPHPGVAPIAWDGEEPVYHKYYQVRVDHTSQSYPLSSSF